MAQQIIPSDLQVQGTLTCKQFFPPPACIGPAALVGGPGAYLPATNQQQQFQKEYAQVSTVTAAVERKVVHVVRGITGVLMDFFVAAVTANVGAATVVFDLLKNGASILTGTITLDSTTAAFVLKAGTFSSTSTVAGDVFEVKVVSATAGGGTIALGAFARLTIREDPN